jgi:hypothetical protein
MYNLFMAGSASVGFSLLPHLAARHPIAYMQKGMACLGVWGILGSHLPPVLIQRGEIMSFGLYALGFLIVIGGLIYGAHLMHVPAHWIAVVAIVLLGIGIVTGVQNTRQKDPS